MMGNYEKFGIEQKEVHKEISMFMELNKIEDIVYLDKGFGHESWKFSTSLNSYLFKINTRKSSYRDFHNEITAQKMVLELGLTAL